VVGRDTGDTREMFVLFSVSLKIVFFLLGVTGQSKTFCRLSSHKKKRRPPPTDGDDDDDDGDDAEWKCEAAASPRERISTLKRKTRRVVVQHEQ
jgi:hypothetical protein